MKHTLLKLLAGCMALCILISSAMADLTDIYGDVNVTTLGRVEIALIEKERHADRALVAFQGDKPIIPGVYPENMIFGNEADFWPATVQNAVDKIVSMTNTGDHDAYVRLLFAFEVTGEQDFFNRKIHLNYNEQDWSWTFFDDPQEYNGAHYAVATAVYKHKLAPDHSTPDSLRQVLLDCSATKEDLAALGETYSILVAAQGVEASGFEDAETALNAAFAAPSGSVPGKLSDAVQPLEIRRQLAEVQGAGGVVPYGDYYLHDAVMLSASLSDAPALAYSLNFSDITGFSALPAGYDPDALLEWGKDPGLNMDILHRYGYTGKGAVIAYVDQPAPDHEQYDGLHLHYKNNSGFDRSMHGPAVLSLLAGKDIGTVPEAEVYYYAHASWLADQSTGAECLYQIIEQNKSLPADKKITMVGFSDVIDPSEANQEALEKAVAACEESGIMVWFCGDYSAASFLPMSDKNNVQNLVPTYRYGMHEPRLVHVPSSGRTTATAEGAAEYIYWTTGGLSWTMPYALGLYAIVHTIDPTLTQDDLCTMIVNTAYNSNGMRIVNPVEFVAAALDGVGRSADAKILRDAVAARQKYMYAIMDTAAMSKEDLQAVADYLAGMTEATVLVCDANAFSSTEALYAELQADAAARGGTVVGVQIFGDASMVPAFRVKYKVQMFTGVDDAGDFLTDLFYGNFNNEASVIANGYNVMDHFAQQWQVDLVPDWPVARLPLARGEFSAFFEKYDSFAKRTGLVQQRLVNFSNPIFNHAYHIDDMGTFLNRMNNEFDLLDVDYRLYGNLEGAVPVTTKVLGNFTTENLAKENDAGIMELIINTHGQWNNIDQCVFAGGKEQRRSFLNMDTINSVLDGNPYYLDCWTCSNGFEMQNNLTTAALNGNCVGMFSATSIISNNGVNCNASVAQMKQGNFYYFYYSYLQALHSGMSRSQAFCAAQKAYARALMADSVNGIRSGEGNYQFNLCNLLAYHNFGVLEPVASVVSAVDATGYIMAEGAPQEKPPASSFGKFFVTNGTPAGEPEALKWGTNNMLQSGSYTIHSYTAQPLNNEHIRFTIEYTAPQGMSVAVFNPPNGDVFMLHGAATSGNRESQSFDLKVTDVQAADTISMSFNRGDNDRFFVFTSMAGASRENASAGGSSGQFVLTNGTPAGKSKALKWKTNNMLQSGSFKIHSYTAQPLNNEYIRFTIEYTAPEGMTVAVFNPPNGDVFMLHGAATSGNRESQSFDLKVTDVQAADTISMSFNRGDNDRFFVTVATKGLSPAH